MNSKMYNFKFEDNFIFEKWKTEQTNLRKKKKEEVEYTRVLDFDYQIWRKRCCIIASLKISWGKKISLLKRCDHLRAHEESGFNSRIRTLRGGDWDVEIIVYFCIFDVYIYISFLN